MFSYYLFADCIFKTEVFFQSSCSVFKSRTKNLAGKHFPGNQLCARGLRGLCSSVKMAR